MKTYEELMYELEERKAMSILQRRKMGIRMRKMMKNPAVQAKIARSKKKLAPDSKILQRANKAAKQIIIKKFAGLQPNEYANLSLMQRQTIDNKIVSKKSGAIKKIAKKLIIKLKKAELERLKKAREVGNQ
tara:strand:+ start:5567 stop:5959 length:393 start_codon:yes stop_codon:yes gene_type:complete